MSIQTSRKHTFEVVAPDGAKLTYRAMDSWERATWGSIPRPNTEVFKRPIIWCAQSWEGVRDSAGTDIPFPGNPEQIIDALANVSANTITTFCLAIIGQSKLSEDDRKNSDSVPSPTAAS
jgi:hypothetical protein